MNPIHATALAFAEAGVSVVPAAMNGTKAPIGTWKQYQLHPASREQIDLWFSGSATGLGIITGKVSGNLEMVELEGRAVSEGCLDQIRELAASSGLQEIWQIISNGYVEATPSGGIHFLWRIADEPVPGNLKLAQRPGEGDSLLVYSETRGEGGFCITAPSHGQVHPSGQPWQLLRGSPAEIPMLSWDERNAIVDLFRSIDQSPKREILEKSLINKVATDEDLPGDDFNERGQWKDILKGWKVVYEANGVTYWRRPGKDIGISASTGHVGDNLYVFTTSTSFESQRSYSKFGAFAHLYHQDDFREAAKALRSQGFGSQKMSEIPSLGELMAPNVAPNLALVPDIDADHIEPAKERSSWYPRPLDLDGEIDQLVPEFLAREDGHRLFYKGKINAVLGESESGKTWVALLGVKQALDVAERVIYLDFEDSGKGILARLRSMGVEDIKFKDFIYANPDQNLTLEERMDLVDALSEFQPDWIIVDGVNAAMTLLNLELTSNRDATFFSQQLLRPLAQSGAGVITIDHVPKSKDNRGDYAIGAQAKRADINGSAIAVSVSKPFGKGMTGELNLKVTKDRPGSLREHSKDAKFAGKVILKSDASGKVMMSIQNPQMGEEGQIKPTHLMEAVSRLLEGASMPLSKSAVIKETTGKTEWVMIAIKYLIEENFIEIENGSRNSLNLKLLKPYRESKELGYEVNSFELDEASDA
jgi:Bifunctional DNA primase/polymerase, N-terminal/AAA domain